MGESLLLASQKVSAQKLQASGYEFLYPEIEGALRHLLGR
jgi:NAD dependent epimerase/dehydratase family enzyme